MYKTKKEKVKSHKSKILALVLVPVLMIALLTGCTPAELGLYDLQKEMSNLNLYETKGEANIKLEQLPKELKDELGETDFAMLEMLLKYSTLSYDMRINVEEEFMEGNFYLINKLSTNKEKLVSYMIKGDDLYLEMDDLKRILGNFKENEAIQEFLTAVGDAKYLHINSKEDLETPLYGDGQIEKQRDLSIRLLDGLVYEVYNDFELGMIDQDGDTYTIKVDADSITNFLKPFLMYSLENSNRLGVFSKDFISSLDSEELAMLQLSPEMQTEAVAGIDEVLTNVNANKEEMKAEIAKMDAFMNPMIKDTLGDSKIETKITKKAEDTYSTESEIKINIKDPLDSAESFNMSITEKATSTVIKPFKYELPTEGVMSYEALARKLPSKMEVSLEGDFYTLSNGLEVDFDEMETHLIDNRAYLPLRQVAEAFHETVVWDGSTENAYIESGDKRIEIKGTVIDDLTYVQIRDFEKADYSVKYNAKLNMVIIKK